MRASVATVLRRTAWIAVLAAGTGCADDPDSYQPTRASDASVSDAARPDAGFDASAQPIADGGLDASVDLDASLQTVVDAASDAATDSAR